MFLHKGKNLQVILSVLCGGILGGGGGSIGGCISMAGGAKDKAEITGVS
jgi:hypothetical protein